MRVTSTKTLAKTTESQVRVTRSIARRRQSMKMVVDQFSLSKLERLSEVLRRQESSAYLRHIGEGKFANVYKVSNASELCRLISAENEDSASTTSALQKIAIRIIRPDTDSDFARQEHKSALLVCNRVVKPHPNLVRERIFRNGISIQPLYDDDLENIVYRTGKPLARKDLSSVMQRMANAVHYLHEHGIGHFDIKPENILVRWPVDSGRGLDGATIALTDMGLAARLGTKGEYWGMWRGTEDYMAPELAKLTRRGKLCHGTACDVFSLGVSMLWLGTFSFSRSTDLCKKCGPFLGELISKMLVREPEDRISMSELLSELS